MSQYGILVHYHGKMIDNRKLSLKWCLPKFREQCGMKWKWHPYLVELKQLWSNGLCGKCVWMDMLKNDHLVNMVIYKVIVIQMV